MSKLRPQRKEDKNLKKISGSRKQSGNRKKNEGNKKKKKAIHHLHF